jgi:hypothetical protein
MRLDAFDILKRQEDGSLIWLEAARDLEMVKSRLEQLSALWPGEYFVFDQQTQKIIATFEVSTTTN